MISHGFKAWVNSPQNVIRMSCLNLQFCGCILLFKPTNFAVGTVSKVLRTISVAILFCGLLNG